MKKTGLFLLKVWDHFAAVCLYMAIMNLCRGQDATDLKDPIVVDAVFLYDQTAVESVGGTELIHRAINAQVRVSNEVMVRSEIGVTFQDVGHLPIAFDYQGSLDQAYEQLKDFNTLLGQKAQEFRLNAKADLLVLILGTSSDGEALANILTRFSQPLSSKTGIVAVTLQRLSSDPSVLIHEWGHNFGCDHDFLHRTLNPALPYAYGHHFKSDKTSYGTVMSYVGLNVPFFSNPNVQFQGVRLGVQGQADNAGVIRQTAPLIAEIHEATQRVSFLEQDLSIQEGGDVIQVEIHRTGDVSGSLTMVIEVKPVELPDSSMESVAEISSDLILDSNEIQFAAGESTTKLSFTVPSDGEIEEWEVISLHLSGMPENVGWGRYPMLNVHIDDADSVIRFQKKRYYVSESDIHIPLVLEANLKSGAKKRLKLEAHSVQALPGHDFVEPDEWVVVEGGDPLHVLSLPILIDDAESEFDEMIQLRLVDDTSGKFAETEIVVVDDDRYGALDLIDPQFTFLGGRRTLSMAPMEDGKILIGGNFTRIQGQTRSGLAMLNHDFSLNEDFSSIPISITSEAMDGMDPSFVEALPLSDGRVIIYRSFHYVDGEKRRFMARLNSDGTLDTSFVPSDALNFQPLDVIPLAEGKLLVAGYNQANDPMVEHLMVRLNEDGSLDDSFQLDSRIYGRFIWTVKPDREGRYLLGGVFDVDHGQLLGNLARIHADGSLDETFMKGQKGPADRIYAIEVLRDGCIVVGGTFTTLHGVSQRYLVRLNPDGTLDHAFDIRRGVDGIVRQIVERPDGKLLIGGEFSRYNRVAQAGLVQVLSDGSLDESFDANLSPKDYVHLFEMAPNGDIYLSGVFDYRQGEVTANLARLRNASAGPALYNVSHHDSGTELSLQAIPSGKLRIEYSKDFLSWSTLSEPVAQKHMKITDPETDVSNRFYRVVQEQ